MGRHVLRLGRATTSARHFAAPGRKRSLHRRGPAQFQRHVRQRKTGPRPRESPPWRRDPWRVKPLSESDRRLGNRPRHGANLPKSRAPSRAAGSAAGDLHDRTLRFRTDALPGRRCRDRPRGGPERLGRLHPAWLIVDFNRPRANLPDDLKAPEYLFDWFPPHVSAGGFPDRGRPKRYPGVEGLVGGTAGAKTPWSACSATARRRIRSALAEFNAPGGAAIRPREWSASAGRA